MPMSKPPLFFIHGMWSRPQVWDALRARFEALGYATHAPALPWHDGPSDVPPPELAVAGIGDYVAFLIDRVEQLGEPPVIVGHSMGGMLAQLVAERVRPAGLVLLSPGPTATTNVLGVAPLRTVFGVTSQAGWWKKPTLIDRERARWGIFNEVPADIAEREIDALVWDSGRVLFQMAMPWADPAKGSKVDYARLDMPALVVVGDRDRITPVGTARATARRLTGQVDYRELSGVGHWLFHEPVLSRTATEIEAFLDRLPAG
jgi:pimeloyl-ACP methyl ester carboxylesterase